MGQCKNTNKMKQTVETKQRSETRYDYWTLYHELLAFRIASSRLAGISPPAGGVFLLLNSSDICSNVTHSTPSCELINSIHVSIE